MTIDQLKIRGFTNEQIAEAIRWNISPVAICRLIVRYAQSGPVVCLVIRDLLDVLREAREDSQTAEEKSK